MVARLTPDQKVACSSHVGVNFFVVDVVVYCLFIHISKIYLRPREQAPHDQAISG